MPVRTITFKLRGASGIAKDLWHQHAATNAAGVEFSRILLALRGEFYAVDDGDGGQVLIEQAAVQEECLRLARAAQAANGNESEGSDEEVLALCRKLYVAMFPASESKEAGEDAKHATGYIGNLVDPVSVAGFSAMSKAVPPPWLVRWRELEVEKNAKKWLTSEEGKLATKSMSARDRLQCARQKQIDDPACAALVEEARAWEASPPAVDYKASKGRPPSWIRFLPDPTWVFEFDKYTAGKAEQCKDVVVVFRLRELGILPLMRGAPIARKIGKTLAGKPVYCSAWDRAVFSGLAGAIISWEKKCHDTAASYAALEYDIAAMREQLGKHPAQVAAYEAYETSRTAAMEGNPILLADSRYTITTRTASGWDKLLEKWQGTLKSTRKAGKPDSVVVERICSALDKRRKKSGDVNLWKWLAGEIPLWESGSALWNYARLGGMRRKLGTKRRTASYREPDARLHPRWTMFAPGGSSNAKAFELREDVEDGLQIRFCLLREEDGRVVDGFSPWLGLASNRQAQKPELVPGAINDKGKEGRKRLKYCYRTRLGGYSQENLAEVKSVNVMFDRKRLEGLGLDRLERGEAGDAWIKMPLDLAYVLDKGNEHWVKHTKAFSRTWRSGLMTFFNTSFGSKGKAALKKAKVEGLRVMSFHPGMRRTGACSVYVHSADSGDRPAFATDLGTFARHERSFVLRLPGTDPNLGYEEERRRVKDEISGMRKAAFLISDLVKAVGVLRSGVSVEHVAKEIEKEKSAKNHEEDLQEILPALARLTGENAWKELLEDVRALEDDLARRINKWIRLNSPRRRRAYGPGYDLWKVAYIEDVINLLKGWSLRARHPGEIKRLSSLGGRFCGRRLAYLERAKKVLTEATADLIVMSARGYVYDREAGWEKRWPACRLIILEDLSRYQFRLDRPRSENSKLMQWSHRKLEETVRMQAEIYGIHVESVGSGWTSRIDAQTGAPGLRCRPARECDLGKKWFEERCQEAGVSPSLTKVGDLVPDDGGDLLASPSKGRVRIVNADINAAQNLHRRYWTRYRYPTYIPVRFSDDELAQGILVTEGKRLRGAMKFLYKKECVTLSKCEEHSYVAKGTRKDPDSFKGPEKRLFRDWSGQAFGPDQWIERKEFWEKVREVTMLRLEEAGKLALAAKGEKAPSLA